MRTPLHFHELGEEPEFSRQCFSESAMSGEYFGRLIATGEWDVCLLSSFKARYPKNNNNFQKTL